MRITVLGANGFLGKHLVSALSKDSSIKIAAFDHFSSIKESSPYDHPFDKMENVTIHRGDFLNTEDVRQSIRNSDCVFHLISTTNPATSMDNPLLDIDTNVRGSIQLLSICAEENVKKIVFFSSGGAVYGDIDSDKITEDARLSPLSPYAIGKVTIEYYLEYFRRSHGLDYLIYRVANPYGPGQNIHGKQGVIPIFMKHVLEDQPINVYGDGGMVRDYIYIDDLMDLVRDTFYKQTKHKIYNLGSGDGSSVNDIIAAIESVTGKEVSKNHIKTPAVYVQRSVLDINRFTSEFDIQPKISLREGIEKTWEYVKSV